MARSAPAKKPDPVSALLALRMQARGFSRGWSVSPYRGRARLRVTAGAGDGKQRQVLMGLPWSAAHAEDIAAAAVAAREAFVAGMPLDQALQLHVGRQDRGEETINANCPAETEPSLDPDLDGPINWPALIESYRERKISTGELKSSTWDKIWQPGMREVLAVMHRHPSPSDSRQLLEAVTQRWSQQPGARGRQMRVQQTTALLRWGVDGDSLPKCWAPPLDLGPYVGRKRAEVNRTTRLDWDALRTKVKGGMRNATLMAIAPTASIGLVAGTTPGLDPQFSQIFSRATSSGKFLEINRNLVEALRERGLWETTRESILRSQGDIQGIDSIPQEIKDVYKTSFQLSPFAFLEVAARAQKWIDQAISRNMYLETRDIDDLMSIYTGAWKRGVKTTYYLHMKPRHTAEQSTVKVNKAEQINGSGSSAPKKGFGAATPAAKEPAAASSAPAKGFGFGSATKAGE